MKRFRFVCMKGTLCILESVTLETLVSLHNGTSLNRKNRTSKTFVSDKRDRVLTRMFCRNLHLTFILCSGLSQKDLLKRR